MVEFWSHAGRGRPSIGLGQPLLPALGIALLSFLGGCEFQAQPPEDAPESAETASSPEAEIEAMLDASAGSWNGGDLEGFLDDYWRSDNLTFMGSTGVTRGWEDVRTRYQSSYWAPGAARDSLRFEGIEVTLLGDSHALALGQYVLFRPEDDGAVSSTGFFSLVLARTDAGWKILHDHTSATPPQDGTDAEGS